MSERQERAFPLRLVFFVIVVASEVGRGTF